MKKKLIEWSLRLVTIKIIKKYQPTIIAVTGSVGKTSTKDAIFESLKKNLSVSKSGGNLNTEVGAPLVFVQHFTAPQSSKEWGQAVLKGIKLVLKKEEKYPEVIVCELGADKPGDIKYLTSFIKPDISIVTAVGDVPVHVEAYKNTEEVALEKSLLLSATKKSGTAIINADDPYYDFLRKKVPPQVNILTFGYHKESSVRIDDFKINNKKRSSLSLEHKNKKYRAVLDRCISSSFPYTASAAFATLIALQIPPHKTTKALKEIKPTPGRMLPVEGIRNSTIIDGSYNAAPLSMKSSLETLKIFPGKRKIAVIGDMLELGSCATKEHIKIGQLAGEFCNFVIAVGEHATDVEKGVRSKKNNCQTFTFKKSEMAVPALKEIIKPRDAVLVKGSQSIRTEKIVYAIMKNKKKASALLVRQTPYWKNKQ